MQLEYEWPSEEEIMIMNKKLSFLISLLILLVGCSSEVLEMNAPVESIGTATMLVDGTIVLYLRAETDSGGLGDAQFSYRPDDPDYEKIKTHIGGIKPGDKKPVPPWPREGH